MAKLSGFEGSVVFATNSLANVEEWSTDESAQIFTGSAKKDPSVIGRSGPVTRKLNLTLFLDPSDTAGQGSITINAELTNFELYPAEDTTGNTYYTCTSGIIESIQTTSPMDLCRRTVTVHLNAPLVEATVA